MSDFTDKQNGDRITIGDVADALGVSRTTVSRAISGKGRIGTATRDKVLRYIEKNNYRPSAIAKSLANSKTYNIGLVIPGDCDAVSLPFFQKCMMGISEIASLDDYDVVISMVTEKDVTQLKRIIENKKVDGVILSRTLSKDLALDYLNEKRIPFVAIGSTVYDVYTVDNDHISACAELTSILLMKFSGSIGLIGGDESHVVTQSRLDGYKRAFVKAGMEVNKSNVFLNVSNAQMVGRAVEQLLAQGVECIVCMDDSICSMSLYYLKMKGIEVPNQVRLASFYDSAFLESNIPSITALQFDVEEISRTACRKVLDLIDGAEVEKNTVLGYDVVLKESTK